jgi:hypothetical protein
MNTDPLQLMINQGTEEKPDWISVASYCEQLVDNSPAETEGTPVTRESLLLYGYTDYAASLAPEELEKEADPFYYIKGTFKLFDLGSGFYTDASTEPGLRGGARVHTMEQLAEVYEAWTGRLHTVHIPLEDTAPVLQAGLVLPSNPKSSNLIKIKLQGGPGDGQIIFWPKQASFYLLQSSYKGKTEGHRYQRKPRCKKIFVYVGPTQ